MKTNIYKCLLIVLAFAITGCEDPILSAPVAAIPENSAVGQKVTQITVENAGNSVLASIVLNGSGAENFAVDMQGQITVAENAHLDYESINVYNLTAVATSTRGESVSGDILINILDVADVVPSILNFTAAVNENSAVGTLIGTVGIVSSGDSPISSFSLSDANNFSINEKGEIRTSVGLDYESINHYSLSVDATNAAGISNTATVEITVTDIADIIPRILGFTTSIERDTPIGSVVGTVTIESIGDSPITNLSISDNDTFEISANGVVTTKALLDAQVYTMAVTATNTAGTDTGLIEITTLADAFTIKPFTANYYLEEDGTEAGQGTDGSDVSIVPVLKYTETVTRPAITYSWSNEFGIDSYNLYTTWEGEIEVNEASDINASFDVSWSDVAFYIDDTLIFKWANSNKVIPISLAVGTHTVRIEYHNHWHTTGFNVSFTNYERTSAAEDISAKISDSAQINYLSAYDIATSASRSKYNEVQITLPQSNRPQVLFLSSYAAINWVIHNPHNTKLEGVVFNSYGPGSTVSNTDKAFVLYAPDFASYSQALTLGTENIISMTGRTPDYLYDENYFYDIEISGL